MPLVRRRPLAGLAALGAAALIAGCGGGGSDSLSADEFRERADAICADADERFGTLTQPTTGDEVLPFLQAGLPIGADELEQIGELEPPDDLQAALDEAQDLNQQRLDLIQQGADRIEGGEDARTVIAEINPESERLQGESRAKARELGLTVCGSDDDSGAAAAPAGGVNAQYTADVREAAVALRSVGSLLASSSSIEGLRDSVAGARAQLDAFDAAVARLDDYTLDDDALEKGRSGLAAAGPPVGDALRRFFDAVEDGDVEAVQSSIPEVREAIDAFDAAVAAIP